MKTGPTAGLTPATVIDSNALLEALDEGLGDAVRVVFATVDDADIDTVATDAQMLAIAEAYVRRLKAKMGEPS